MFKLLQHTLIFTVLICLISACSTDFEVNEPGKEIDVIYGLLDLNDSVQYVRVNKAFLNTKDQTVYELAKDPNYIYHQDTLLVELIENGTNNIRLIKTNNSSKDTGIFASPAQTLYRTPFGTILNENSTYILSVKNTNTGVIATGKTSVVGRTNPIYPKPESSITLSADPKINFPINFQTGKSGYFYDTDLILRYTRISKTDTSIRTTDSIIWNWQRYQFANSNQGGEEIRNNLKYDQLVELILNTLKTNPAEKIRLDYIRLNIAGGSQDLYTYIQLYSPATGIVQKRSDYTNISNGYGIYSSRNRTSYKFFLNTISKRLFARDSRLLKYTIVEY